MNFGAIVLSSPSAYTHPFSPGKLAIQSVEKHHICVSCEELLMEWLNDPIEGKHVDD